MNRRDFLKSTAVASTTVLLGTPLGRISRGQEQPADEARALARKLPRWRGFNLLEKFNVGRQGPFVESDFAWMAEWGFDFVRLPMDYRCWTDTQDPYRLNEKVLQEIDQAVEWGRQYKIHVCLNLHRAPGYTVARPPEKLDLWTSEEAQKQFDFQWAQFARRYKGIPPSQLSFNLVNEPARIEAEVYVKVARRVVAAIRREDPQRLIISDGLQWGREPLVELLDLGIAQSTRGYAPMQLTHYQASWVNSRGWPEPTWPMKQGNKTLDRDYLFQEYVKPWRDYVAKGGGAHVGEWGAYNKTPHDVVLRWARDFLGLWQEAGLGWALWNFRGSFGILDSQRRDVAYEDFRGHQLDRRFLELLREF